MAPKRTGATASVGTSAGPTPCSSDASAGPTLTAPTMPSAVPAPRMTAHGRITVQNASRGEAPRANLTASSRHRADTSPVVRPYTPIIESSNANPANVAATCVVKRVTARLSSTPSTTRRTRSAARYGAVCTNATRERRDHRPRIALCAGDQVPFPYWELLDRHVQRGTVGFAGWRDIPDDADNGQGVLTEGRRQPRGQRRAPAEEVAHKGRVHDGHPRSELRIRAHEPPASRDGNPHCIEVGGTDGSPGGRRIELTFTPHTHRRPQACHLRGQPHRHRDSLNARQCLALRDQLPKQLSSVSAECAAQVQVDGDELVHRESVVERDEVLQAAGQQSCADGQDDGDRDLYENQHAPAARSWRRALPPHAAQGRRSSQAREAEGRCDADSQAGQHSGGQPDAENPAIEGDLRQPRDTHRRHCDQNGDRPASEQQAQRTTGQRKDQAFGDQLSDTRARVAPSAPRTAISPARSAPRAPTNAATFAQAMSSVSIAAAKSA